MGVANNSKGGDDMETSISRVAVRLNEMELRKAALDKNMKTNKEIAKAIGVSTVQLGRAMKSPTDPDYNAPGEKMIAGVLAAFGEPFERFFFLT